MTYGFWKEYYLHETNNIWYTIFSPFISSLKNVELSKLQMNLDDVAKSLIRYSASEQHKYESPSLTVQIRRNLEIPTVDFETENGDEISLTSPDIDHIASSVSFVSFSNFGCIVDGRFNW